MIMIMMMLMMMDDDDDVDVTRFMSDNGCWSICWRLMMMMVMVRRIYIVVKVLYLGCVLCVVCDSDTDKK